MNSTAMFSLASGSPMGGPEADVVMAGVRGVRYSKRQRDGTSVDGGTQLNQQQDLAVLATVEEADDAAATGTALDDAAIEAVLADLPRGDNTPEALRALQDLNRHLRNRRWPPPFNRTEHRLHVGDARQLDWLPDESVHLVVTSPPYWTLKKYNEHVGQLGAVENYEAFLDELDTVWKHCARALVPGGRIVCVVGDVCIPRRVAGRHLVMPLHADIQVRVRKIGLDNLTPIHWYKIANGVMEAGGNGAGYYGKPYQPGAVVKNDVEYILFFRKGGQYRSPSSLQKALSMLTREEMQTWCRTVWADIPGTSTAGHPAPYPVELATRLIRMFSFAGDTVLDPFLGTGTTSIAAIETGRNSIGVEIDPTYFRTAATRIRERASETSLAQPAVADMRLE